MACKTHHVVTETTLSTYTDHCQCANSGKAVWALNELDLLVTSHAVRYFAGPDGAHVSCRRRASASSGSTQPQAIPKHTKADHRQCQAEDCAWWGRLCVRRADRGNSEDGTCRPSQVHSHTRHCPLKSTTVGLSTSMIPAMAFHSGP